MKKLFMLLLCLTTSLVCYSQQYSVQYKWQSDGSILNSAGSSYDIFEFEGKMRDSIFDEVLTSVSSIFIGPINNVTTHNHELIQIDAVVPHIEYDVIVVDFHYTIKIFIKDEKIKIDTPYLTALTFNGKTNSTNVIGWTKVQKFFNSDGTPSTKKKKLSVYNDLNKALSSSVNKILSNLYSTDNW